MFGSLFGMRTEVVTPYLLSNPLGNNTSELLEVFSCPEFHSRKGVPYCKMLVRTLITELLLSTSLLSPNWKPNSPHR